MRSSRESVDNHKRNLRKVYTERPKGVHKGNYGNLLVIGGSKKYSGSPAFNALAAYRSGVDLAEIIAPKRVADIIASFSPDLITIPVHSDYLTKQHLDTILEEADNKTAFVIGGGLGRKEETLELVREFLNKTELPGVIDADAIHALKGKSKNNIDLSNFVITPHANEFKVLTGKELKKSLDDRTDKVEQAAEELDTVILLKGPKDVISNGEKTEINETGDKYMTVGGTGDVLTGIVGSLLAQGNSLFESAKAGAYINGEVGRETRMKRSLMASDMINNMGKVVDVI